METNRNAPYVSAGKMGLTERQKLSPPSQYNIHSQRWAPNKDGLSSSTCPLNSAHTTFNSRFFFFFFQKSWRIKWWKGDSPQTKQEPAEMVEADETQIS